MRTQLTSTLLVGILAVAGPLLAADTPQPQVVLTIMSQQINSFAPGVDAAVGLSNDQAKQLAVAYSEVFNSSAVALANMVLQDGNASGAQRQAASATLQQAQLLFQARGRAVLTPAQAQLVDKIQASFSKVFAAAQAQMNTTIKTNFGAELEILLSPEQKQAMYKARAAIEAAQKAAEQKAAEQKPAPATGGGAAQ